MVVLSGAQHPIAAHLWINFNLDAADQRREHELHRLHGPERGGAAAAQRLHRRRPRINPPAELLATLIELKYLPPADLDVHRPLDIASGGVTSERDQPAVDPGTASRLRGGHDGPAPGSRRASSSCPGSLLARRLLPGAARDHRRRQPRLGRRRAAHVTLTEPEPRGTTSEALKPGVPAAFGRSIYYSLATTVLSLVIGYPVAYWISRYGGRRKILLLVLVMLPFWTSYLIRTYAWMIILRDNGVVNSLLMQTGLIDEPDPVHQHGLQRDPRHDLRLPAVHDPAAVRLDRPARLQPRPGRRATCTPPAGGHSCTSRCR